MILAVALTWVLSFLMAFAMIFDLFYPVRPWKIAVSVLGAGAFATAWVYLVYWMATAS